MQHLEVSGAVRYIYIYIYVIRRLKVKYATTTSTFNSSFTAAIIAFSIIWWISEWGLRSPGIFRRVDWYVFTDVRDNLSGQAAQEECRNVSRHCSWTTWSMKMGSIGCRDTSIINYQPTLLKIPEEGRSPLHRCRSSKPRNFKTNKQTN